MNSLATIWSDLQRSLSSSPEDWPVYACPAGHEVVITPFSRLWDKETSRLISRPVCFECENAKRAASRSLSRHFADRETALRARGIPASFARQPFLGGMPQVLGHDLAAWTGDPPAWGIVLHGVGNAGKSMLAAELLWRRLPHVQTAAWWRAAQLVDALFGSLGEGTKDRANQDCAADLLVIDDLGHVVGNRGYACLFNVIVSRQEDDRATIVTLDEPLLAFCKRQRNIGSTLARRTLPLPFIQTYAQRTEGRPRGIDRGAIPSTHTPSSPAPIQSGCAPTQSAEVCPHQVDKSLRSARL